MQSPTEADDLFIGLMSGTSADGIDAALVAIDADGRCRFVDGLTAEWEPELRARLIALGQGREPNGLDELGDLDARIGLAFAAASNRLLQQAGRKAMEIRAIGSHGQTIRHRPSAPIPFTLQIGDANRIAELTGITTVADFRRRDVAAGGQGAPLMPAFHHAMLGSSGDDRAVLNLGGIANLTLLPSHGTVRGFDTGPANALCDAWCQRHTGQPYDRDGALAASGRLSPALLGRLSADPWFSAPPPKSTGREQFHLDWVQTHLHDLSLSVADVQATLLELSVVTVVRALHSTLPACRQLLVCGGGVRNIQLMHRLQAHLPDVEVASIRQAGMDPDYVEAMGFAWLARQVLDGLAGNLPEVTGAAGPRLLGAIHPA